MIISGGVNIYPIDIETKLVSHEAVKDASVVGLPHEKWGETPVAVVILNEGHDVDEETLFEWYNSSADKYQRLNKLIIRSADFPRNTLGKVVKPDLIKEIEQ